jgi:DNA-binding IclR family transcriptional regulator
MAAKAPDIEKQNGENEGVQGTQSVQRAVAVLRFVAQSGSKGCRANELSAKLNLTLATTDRMLRALAQEQLVERFGPGRLYRIGTEVVALAATRLQRFSLLQHFEGVMEHITEESQDTVFLWVRSGSDAVCIARREGAFPIRALAVDVGARRPLGAGAGPLAQLAFLPRPEMEQIVKKHSKAYANFGLTAAIVDAMIEKSEELGYALNDGRIIPEMSGIALPIYDVEGRVVASLSLTAINARLRPNRAAELAKLMRQAIQSAGPASEGKANVRG